MIRKAIAGDIKEIQNLIGIYADKGQMLPRSLSELYDHLRDFHVYMDEKKNNIIGVCAIHICWEDLSEVRSLAVKEEFQGRRIGFELVKASISESRALGVNRIFVLTYQVEFFKRLGFEITDKAVLPQKIWADCLKCAKFPDCDETAMILNL